MSLRTENGKKRLEYDLLVRCFVGIQSDLPLDRSARPARRTRPV